MGGGLFLAHYTVFRINRAGILGFIQINALLRSCILPLAENWGNSEEFIVDGGE